MNADLRARYPRLFSRRRVSWASGKEMDVRFTLGMPPEELISNVNVLGYVGDRCLVLRSRDFGWMLPGGTLEPGEAWRACLERELAEEAGARLLGYEPIGAWRYVARYEEPYRPHLPFPVFCRLLGFGEVELVGRPSNPEGGETIISVELLPPAEAAACFLEKGEDFMRDALLLADELRRGC